MHIGIDFDNTLVNYDRIFHKYARLKGFIGSAVPVTKAHVRAAIQKLPQGNDKWTVLQGLVYGRYAVEAPASAGVKRFLQECRVRGIQVSVISHKTVYPEAGEKINLRDVSLKWLAEKRFTPDGGIARGRIHFTDSLAAKLAKIGELGCTHYIDDLAFVLTQPDFPPGVIKILYSRRYSRAENFEGMRFGSFDKIRSFLFP